MGKLADRFGVMWPLLFGAVVPGRATSPPAWRRGIVSFTAAQALLVGLLGSSAAFRAAGGRHLAVVRQAARHRGGGVRERQLPRRRGVAADRAALRRDGGLAPDLHRHGHVLRRLDALLALCLRARPPALAEVVPAPAAGVGLLCHGPDAPSA
jgi:hypothetical protein